MISGNHCSCVWYIDENNVASKLIATTYFIGIFGKYLINSRKKTPQISNTDERLDQ